MSALTPTARYPRRKAGPLRRTALLACLLLAALLTPLAASASDNSSGEYLALGDSIAFGYSPLANSSFTGYPVIAARKLELHLTNIACPGETSGHFVALTNPDNGCQFWHTNGLLNPNYNTSQLEYALAFLHTHANTRLVTINIGANDLYLVQDSCKAAHPLLDAAYWACIQAGLPGALNTVAYNLSTIFYSLRASGYQGNIVALTYYSTNYNDDTITKPAQYLNQVITAVAGGYGVKVADGYNIFLKAASKYDNDSCKAGLLIRLPDNSCNVHPSAAGQSLLAKAILKALE